MLQIALSVRLMTPTLECREKPKHHCYQYSKGHKTTK